MVERSISVQAVTVAIVLPLLTVGASFGLAYLAAWSSRASNPDADGFGIAAVFMLTFFATYVVTASLLVRFLLLEGRRLGPGLITQLLHKAAKRDATLSATNESASLKA